MMVAKATTILHNKGVVAFPTETFYGLGADPKDEEAILKIFKIKKRQKGKPIALILSSNDQAKFWCDGIGSREKKLMQCFWPGPLTLILPAKKRVSSLLTAGSDKIGVRVSPHKIASRLAASIGGAITATSANLAGQPASLTAGSVRRKLGRKIDGIVSEERLKRTRPSTIVDCTGSEIKILRPGAISEAEILECLN